MAVNIFSALVDFPGPASDPGRQPEVVWQMAVFFTGLAVVVPSTLVSFFLVWKGLGEKSAPQVRSEKPEVRTSE